MVASVDVTPTERRFEVLGLELAARAWGRPGGHPVLAVHGWLDNAASFDLLAPLLTDCHVLAIDCAGHGHSDYRSLDSAYNVWQDVGDLVEIADQLGWQRFSLLGHSRGAGISMLLAASFPERVDSLLLVEGGIPVPGAAGEAPGQLARALAERAQLAQDSGRVFATRERAIEERMRGIVAISAEAAEVLARRSLRRVTAGFQWRADRRLKAASELRLTPELLVAFIERVTAPALFVEGSSSTLSQRPFYSEMLPYFRDLTRLRLPGGHHLHLEGAQDRIAAAIGEFLAARAAAPV